MADHGGSHLSETGAVTVTGLCAVTVIGARRRADVSLPAQVPVAELLAYLAGLVGDGVQSELPRWSLFTLSGERLDPERDLSSQEVPEGSVLFLRDVAVVPPPPVVEDYPAVVAITAGDDRSRWSPGLQSGLLFGACVVWIAAGVTALLASGAGGRGPAAAIGMGVALLTGLTGIVAGRLAGARRVGLVFGIAALPVWMASFGEAFASTAPSLVTTAAAGLVVGGLVLVPLGRNAVALAAGLIGFGVLVEIGAAVVTGVGASPVVVAAVGVPVLLAVLKAMPRLAVSLAGIETVGAGSAHGDLVRRLGIGRSLMAALLGALGSGFAIATVVLALAPDWWARGLAAAAVAEALLQARHFRFAGEVIALVAAGLIGLAGLEIAVIVYVHGTAQGAAIGACLLVTTAAVLGLAALAGRDGGMPPVLHRRLDQLEVVVMLLVVPLALGALGLYGAVLSLGRSLG